ncbi:MAG: hypothetical protein MR415_11370 [Coriobacteriaceae bacterium]|nr:hypothetical protein [Coriobacteriaceae bacterium]MCI6549221.1 hypothetical protein [Coriobacteriaceae bacterium]
MKLTRRDFLSSAVTAASFLLIPKTVFAAQIDGVGELTDDSSISFEIIDDDTFTLQDSSGTWTVSTIESGPYRIVTVVGQDGSQETISYNRKTGEAYSSATGKTVNLGIDDGYRDVPETRGVIDHDPPVIYNGPSEVQVRYVSYKQVQDIVGNVNNVASVAIAIGMVAGFTGTVALIVKYLNDAIGIILPFLKEGDPNHGFKITVTVTERYTIHQVTGAHIYYDTIETVNSITTY